MADKDAAKVEKGAAKDAAKGAAKKAKKDAEKPRTLALFYVSTYIKGRILVYTSRCDGTCVVWTFQNPVTRSNIYSTRLSAYILSYILPLEQTKNPAVPHRPQAHPCQFSGRCAALGPSGAPICGEAESRSNTSRPRAPVGL